MQIPLELQAQFNTLSPNEIEEIKCLFANLPSQDDEIQSLIADNLDALIEVLIGTEEMLPA
jgi:RNAse (barnase) inhibitor barstar